MTTKMQSVVSRLDAMLTARLRQKVPEPVILTVCGSADVEGVSELQRFAAPNGSVYTFIPPYQYPAGTVIPALISNGTVIPVWPSMEKKEGEEEGEDSEKK